MYKYLILILLVLPKYSFCQSIELNEIVDKIPMDDNNRKFVKKIKKEYSKLIKQKADSILLYYPKAEELSNYAVVYWKKNSVSQWIAYYQFFSPRKNVSKEILENDTLSNTSIKSIHDILQDKGVRKMDFPVFHVVPVYCQFYFGRKEMLLTGFDYKIAGKFNLAFSKALADERYRIAKREIKKNNIQPY